MNKYETKYFGEIYFNDLEEFITAYVKLNDLKIEILISDKNINDGKIKTYLNIIDKYIEIKDIAKESIIKKHKTNRTIKNYFKECFYNLDEEKRIKIFGSNEYKKINLKCVIDKLEYPNLLISLNEKNNKILVKPYFILSKYCSFGRSNILVVIMDDHLKVLKFEHGLVLLC